MNPRTTSLRLRALLTDKGPQAIHEITLALGIKRTRLHGLIHKQGTDIVRFDTTPECGRFARPVYGMRPSLTGSSRVA